MSSQQHVELREETKALRTVLKSQDHAALAMLHESIEKCSKDLWYSDEPTNAFWQVAYHALFFTHLYLQPSSGAFRPWARHQCDVQHPDGITGPPDPTSALPLIPSPYSKVDVLAYWGGLRRDGGCSCRRT
ncbi:MAG TPA: hypothetical protein VMN03_11065 [Burkholderiales bacterium]|nr:hypothetical protein [Burkholderiales bacterium]